MQIDITILYKEYYLRMVLYANKWIKDYQLAEEICADALSALSKQPGYFENKLAMKGWLFTYIRFKCINITKQKDKTKKQVQTFSSWYMDEYLDETKTESKVDYYAIQCEVVCEIYKEIENLQPRVRLIFQLAYFEDKTLDEIAEITHTKKQTIKNQLTYALKQLRFKFNPKTIIRNDTLTHSYVTYKYAY